MIKPRFYDLLDHLQPSETTVLLVTAVAVGAGTGLGAVFFIELIGFIQSLFFQSGSTLFGFLGRGLLILIPLLGGLLAGPVIHYFAQEAKGHGVPEVMQAIALRGGRFTPDLRGSVSPIGRLQRGSDLELAEERLCKYR